MGNNRGTEYSQVHETLTVDDDEFWMYDWAEMGQYDTVANVSKVKELTNMDKILYLGYSQGTTQMFYGLSKFEEDFYADSLLKFAAFAPCIRFDNFADEKIWEHSVFKYEGMGIYHEGGAYQLENLKKICTHMPLHSHCQHAARWIIAQPSSVQSSLHYAQCSIE